MYDQLRELSKHAKKFGYFLPHENRIEGIRFGNWGSRPYEYFWAAVIEDVKGKDVLDIGTGTPTEHNWNQFVKQTLMPHSYIGIDIDERLKYDNINEDLHKVLYMNACDLKLEDNSIDIIYSISTFEHVSDLTDFHQIMKECNRVLRPNGKMIVTLDERWDVNTIISCAPWNDLETDIINRGGKFDNLSFGMKDFVRLVNPLFLAQKEIPEKENANESILHTKVYNSCVSYGVFDVIK